MDLTIIKQTKKNKKKSIKIINNIKLIIISRIILLFLLFIFYRQSYNSHFELQGYTFIETLKQLSQYELCELE